MSADGTIPLTGANSSLSVEEIWAYLEKKLGRFLEMSRGPRGEALPTKYCE